MSWKISNERYSVELSCDFTLEIVDLASGARRVCRAPFKMNYAGWYNYNLAACCEASVETSESSISVKFSEMDFIARFKGNEYRKPEPGPRLEFEFAVTLEDDHVSFSVGEVAGLDDETINVSFPFGLVDFDSSKPGSLIIPAGYGSLLQFPRKDCLKFDYECNYHYNSLPLVGRSFEDGAFLLYIKTPFDSHVHVDINSVKTGKASVDIAFAFRKGFSNYRKELRLYGLPAGSGYVAMAKLYRSVLVKEGRFVSLEKKIETHPDVERLVGAVIWKHDVYSCEKPAGLEHGFSYYMNSPEQCKYEGRPANWTAKELFDAAKERGFDRVCVFNTGWNFQGYDSGYPKRLPPNPKRGTIAEFKAAAEYARKLSPGFIYSVHDNYQDVYENSPEFPAGELVSTKSGEPKPGGIWRGGRAKLLCSEHIMKYAKRDIPEIAAMLGKGGIYIDVLGLSLLNECENPAHPLGKTGDVKRRREALSYIRDQMGSLATEGTPNDYCADIVDLGAFSSFSLMPANQTNSPAPLPVPFWQLVYHDSVLNYTCESAYRFHGDDYLLLVALYGMLPTQIDEAGKRLSFGLRSAFKAEMLSHEFLEGFSVTWREDGTFRCDGAAKSVFSDGTLVVANFNDVPFLYEGTEIPPRDYAILTVAPSKKD